MRGWIQFSLLTSACALTWACGGAGGGIVPNPTTNANVVSATSTTAIVGRSTLDMSANQILSSAPLRNPVAAVDIESTTDSNNNAVDTLTTGDDLTGLPGATASKPGDTSRSLPEPLASADKDRPITVISIGKGMHIHVFGNGHGHPLIIIVDDTDTSTVADMLVRQKSPISRWAESAPTNRVRGSLSS